MPHLRSKFTYSNVISTLCLILLLGGGTAYAAGQLGKESVGTKQLAKGAVTPAKLSKASKATLTGPTGVTGLTGAQGSKGDAGVKGDAGEKGEPGSNSFPSTLPSGATEHGIYILSGQRPANPPPLSSPNTAISFPIPLAAQPHQELIAKAGSPTAHCPGSYEEPKAAPDYLCVQIYEESGTWAVTAP